MKRVPPFAALVVAATLGTVPTPATAAAPARHAESCAQVFTLGIGGSGEPTASNPAGRTVAAALQAFDEATDVSTASLAMAWRPAGVGARTLGTARRGWRSPYLRGARSAASSTVSALTQRAATCPDESIALVGFSQGTVVARLALRSLQRSPAIADRIDAIELISDPVRTRRDGGSQVGSARSRHHGILATSRAVLRKVRIPRSRRAAVTSVCTAGDAVCDAGRVGRSRLGKHRAYADRGALARAARLVATDVGLVSTVTKSVDPTDEVFRLINLVRAAGVTCGTTTHPAVGPAKRVPLLDQISQRYAERMAEENFYSHVAPDGSDPSTRASDAGYPNPVVEIIAAGQTTAASAVAAWLVSAEHCPVLMTGHEIGVGHAKDAGSDWVHYWTLNARR